MVDSIFSRTWLTDASPLLQRVITALCLVPLVLAGIFFLSNEAFAVLALIILVMAGWEWATLAHRSEIKQRLYFVVGILISIAIISQLRADWVYWVSGIWWLIATLLVILFPRGENLWGKSSAISWMGYLTLALAWFALVDLQSTDNGSRLMLFILCIIWGADTGAYFAGRRWGRTKLAPNVSPGKSVVGFFGGLIVTLLFTLAVLSQLNLASVDKMYYLMLTMLTVVASVVGDLFESMIKRHSKVKDSGHLLPGHGGLLDRIDSMTAALPIFTAGLYFSGAFT
ncbi:MAG: phosphatidate cytidylyltransferase [Pseudomonadota bacterium]